LLDCEASAPSAEKTLTGKVSAGSEELRTESVIVNLAYLCNKNMSKENIKCFVYCSLADGDVKLAEFSNPSQREFLLSEAQTVVKKVGKKATTMLETVPSSNGTWYYKTDKGTALLSW
jgi:hypothetical protein